MSLLLDDMRQEFAAFLAADPAARYRMDAALAHVVTVAYRRGMLDGIEAASGRPALPPAPTGKDPSHYYCYENPCKECIADGVKRIDRYPLPRCFRCGHQLHAGECVNVAPHG